MLSFLIDKLLGEGLNLLANAVGKKGKQFVEKELGVNLDSDLSDEDLLKLKQYEMEHEEELVRLLVEDNAVSAEIDKAILADVQSARDMQEKAIASGNPFAFMFVNVYASYWTLFGSVFITFIVFGDIPEENLRFADLVLGFLFGSALSPILSFYFGSSKSSQHKDETIKAAIQNRGE